MSSAARTRRYKERHPEKVRATQAANQRVAYARFRASLIEALGGKCARCGIADRRVLAVDHVNNDGAIERGAKRGYQWRRFFRKVLTSALAGESRYQALCHNCNWLKYREGAS